MLYKSFLQVPAAIGMILVFAAIDKAQAAGPHALITQAIDEHRLVTLAGNTRPEANSKNDLGPVGNDLHLDMYLQLKRSPEQDLAAQQFVESLTDQASPNFHKWITAAEYGKRFGAAFEDISTVSRWLESHGFTINGVPANNMVIDFSGDAGQVREALHTEIHTLDVAGKRYFANMSDPQIPAALLPAVTGVVSLNNFKPQKMLVPRAQYTVNPHDLPLVPGDLATIYNLNPAFSGGYTGRGQTIVVVEDTDLYNGSGDWSVFRATFGLTQYPYGSLTQVHPSPGTGGACSDPGINSDDDEAAIDVEWASAAAPNAAIVMASCADTTNFGGFIALQNLLTNGGALPSIVSISYGAPETENGAASNSYINTLYQTAAAAGVSVFVSSGDSAAAGSDRDGTEAIHGINVSGFASTIYNVAVGGTDFGDYAAGTTATFWNSTNGTYDNSAKSYVPEIPWNDSCGSSVLAGYYGFSTTYGITGICNAYPYFVDTTGGSGGPSGCATGVPAVTDAVSGTCAGYGKPAWQSISGNPTDGVRDVPDVALFASNGQWGHYYVFCYSDEGYSCGGAPYTWAGGGGTSFASPIMAGIQALINQALGSKNVGNPNPVYYQIGQNEYSTSGGRSACNSTSGPGSTCSFNDITQGDMIVPCAGAFNCYLDGEALGVLSTSNTSYAPAYAAASGWDFATGIGSVNAFNLLNAFVNTNALPAPVLISPANAATGASPGTAITWNASAGATSYAVYFGTTNPPPFVTNTASTSYAPGSLSAGVTYYWMVSAKNSGAANSSAVWSFTVANVTAVSVTPNFGSGTSQTFTATYSDSSGASAITSAYILIGNSITNVGTCWIEFNVSSSSYYVMNAAGTAWSPAISIGSGSFDNSQCTFSGAGAGATLSGNNLTINFPVAFASGYSGSQNVYLYVVDSNGLNSGWQQLGSFTVTGSGGSSGGPVPVCNGQGTPCVVSLTPGNGSGISGSFTGVFTRSAGGPDLYLGYILFLPTPNVVQYTATGSCLVEYNSIDNAMRLINDAGSNWLPGPVGIPLSQGGTLTNSHCTLNVTSSSAVVSGTTMTVTVAVTFNSSFTGELATFMQGFDVSGAFTGMTQFGNWKATTGTQKAGPYVVSMTPTSGAGSSATLSFTAGDTQGVADLDFVTMLISPVIDGGLACQAFYFPASNTINLVNDSGTAMVSSSGIVPGSAGTLSNSRCAINTGSASSSSTADNVTVTLPMTFDVGTFGGAQNIYLNAFDDFGNLSHWVTSATWTVQ